LTIFLIKFNFQQRNFITLNRSTDEFNNSLVQVCSASENFLLKTCYINSLFDLI